MAFASLNAPRLRPDGADKQQSCVCGDAGQQACKNFARVLPREILARIFRQVFFVAFQKLNFRFFLVEVAHGS